MSSAIVFPRTVKAQPIHAWEAGSLLPWVVYVVHVDNTITPIPFEGEAPDMHALVEGIMACRSDGM